MFDAEGSPNAGPLTGGGRRARAAALGGLLLVAGGCAYDPPMAGDHRSAKYQADLAACQEIAAKTAHHAVISRGYLFATYPISLPIKTRVATRECLEGRGYKLG